MKKLIVLFIVMIPSLLSAQTSDWTEQEKEILNKYSLSENDHRGIIFSNDDLNCDDTASTQEEALLKFLVPDVRKDIIRICTDAIPNKYMDQPLGIHEVVKLYLETTKSDLK